MAEDIYQLASALNLRRSYIVGHDVGAMVAYAFARRHPETTRGAMILDGPLPGVNGWDEILCHPALWHVHFMQVPGLAEKLVAGRQTEYFSYFLSFGKFSNSESEGAKAYSKPSQLHAVFEMYRAFPANAKSNKHETQAKSVPFLLAAGDRSPFAELVPKMAQGLRESGCGQVETAVIRDAVHYVVADQPDQVAELIERHACVEGT